MEIRFSTERLMAIFNAAMEVLRSDTRGLLSLLSFAKRSRLSTRLLYSLICASTVVLVNPEFAGISAPECAGFLDELGYSKLVVHIEGLGLVFCGFLKICCRKRPYVGDFVR